VRARHTIAVLLLAAGCDSTDRALLLPRPPHGTAYDTLIAESPLAAGENIRVRELEHGDSSSVSLVQIRDREQPHVHTRYDLTVTLVEGWGTLWLDGTALPMQAGSTAFIPKGTPHYFVNQGSTPAAALVAFAPPFSGPDQAPVP
jgi:quercetin dioxygenase-like cupin family protein